MGLMVEDSASYSGLFKRYKTDKIILFGLSFNVTK